MRNLKVLGGLCLIAVVFTAGCSEFLQRGGERGGRPEMVVADNLVIPDLPVPAGFKIDNDRSYFNVNPKTGTRVVFVTYRGRGDALALMNFFRQNMAISGWNPKEEAGDFGAYVLDFEKDKEAAEVRIVPGRFKTEFSISVNPRSSS